MIDDQGTDILSGTSVCNYLHYIIKHINICTTCPSYTKITHDQGTDILSGISVCNLLHHIINHINIQSSVRHAWLSDQDTDILSGASLVGRYHV